MAAFHVEVTAAHIAAAGRPPGRDAVANPEGFSQDPLELAIAAATGQPALCDEDVDPVGEIATIGAGNTTLVVRLPDGVHEWINAWFAGDPVEPFGFDVELEDWIVALLARSTTLLEEADALERHEAAHA